MEIIKNYGLLIVTMFLFLTTFWYSVATSRMARVMTRELDLRTKPKLGLTTPSVAADGWKKLEIRHEIVNLGLSYITIDRAALRWWPFKHEGGYHVQECSGMLPVFLAPEDKHVFTFEMGEASFGGITKASFSNAAELITGEVVYEFHGVEEGMVRALASLPSLE